MANGCGIRGYYVDFENLEIFGFNECCNYHDICYSKCRISKKKCDIDLNHCLIEKCNYDKFCFKIVTLIYFLVDFFGCDAFLDSQKNICVC